MSNWGGGEKKKKWPIASLTRTYLRQRIRDDGLLNFKIDIIVASIWSLAIRYFDITNLTANQKKVS